MLLYDVSVYCLLVESPACGIVGIVMGGLDGNDLSVLLKIDFFIMRGGARLRRSLFSGWPGWVDACWRLDE